MRVRRVRCGAPSGYQACRRIAMASTVHHADHCDFISSPIASRCANAVLKNTRVERVTEHIKMTKKNKKKTDSKKPPGSNEPDINDNDSDSSTPVFHVGDRVELQGLKKMKRLNGRHGVVASELDESTGRFCIDLDLLDQLATVAAKPVNLKREAVPIQIDRAQVTGGMLVENQGRAFSLILDVLRYLVAFCLHQDPDIRHFPDIERVKDENLEKAQFLTASAWSYWDDPGANKGTGDRGIYQSAVEFIPEMFSVEDGNTNHLNHEEKRVLRAVTDKVAVAGWNHRIHGDFWIVAKDTNDGGTFAIPDDNKRAVYKVFGMTSCYTTCYRMLFLVCQQRLR